MKHLINSGQRVALTVAILLVTMASLWVAPPADATTGGIQIESYCDWRFGWQAFAAFTNRYNAYSWYCSDGKGNEVSGVDMNKACALTYPWAPGNAKVGNVRDVYSWYCVY